MWRLCKNVGVGYIMPYAYKNENGEITVAHIIYICQDCDFKTESKEDEMMHYSMGHYLRRSFGKRQLYDEKIHGELPGWFKNK